MPEDSKSRRFEDSEIPTLSPETFRELSQEELMYIGNHQRNLLTDEQVVVVNALLREFGDSHEWSAISGPKGCRTFDDVIEW